MNNGLKALLIAASTIITCMIVTLGFSLAKEAGLLGNRITKELSRYQSAVAEKEEMRYDGTVVYGNDIRNLLRQRLSEEKNDIRIRVATKEGETVFSKKEDIDAAEDTESAAYLPPFEEYTGHVIRDKNDVIVEIAFQKNE